MCGSALRQEDYPILVAALYRNVTYASTTVKDVCPLLFTGPPLLVNLCLQKLGSLFLFWKGA